MKIKAWHYRDEFSRNFSLLNEDNLPEIELGVTHECLPLTLDVDVNTETSIGEILGKAFTYFNWMTEEHEGLCPFNQFCRDEEVHASQSVGDVIEISGDFWIVLPVGWKKIN